MNTPSLYIGIDPGTQTGIAFYDIELEKLVKVDSQKIHRAMDIVLRFHVETDIFVRVEDARQRKWFGNSGREKLQGAGSVRRDSKIWEDYLTDNGIPFELVAPKNNMTKLSSKSFKQITGYTGRASQNGRDAAMLVYGFQNNNSNDRQ